ncbi:glutamine synthetase family protein [Aestuariivita boseongensis]|uniref:glutamine synthetase family protein n=1 Tax=Aestuariivita boseongensis TaxID=1470562 RepID=UPI0012FC9162|nr:glutamine synthetase family protein [Aestuariivita boseongensis]
MAKDQTTGPHQSVEDWLATRPEIQTVAVATPDVNGVLRAKAMPRAQAGKIDKGRAAVPLSMPTVDFIGEEIPNCSEVLATGDGDIFVTRAPRDPLPSPSRADTAWVLTDMVWPDGRPVETSCRHVLQRVLDDYATAGLRPVTALEVEFYLYDPSQPGLALPPHPVTGRPMIGRDPCHLDEFDLFGDLFRDITQACTASGVEVIGLGSENGTAMLEVNIAHTADVMKAADDLTLLRLIVRAVARRHGFGATFMPKPFPDLDGAGLHLHVSVLDEDGQNIFDDGTDQGSATLRHAVAGLLDRAVDMQLIMAPHFSSYRRLRANAYAPTLLGWGHDNRFLPIRIPGGDGANRRIEHRIGGADANPYLLTAVLLRAILDGVLGEMPPPDPIIGNPFDLGLDAVPTQMADALRSFRDSDWMQTVLPPLFHEAFLNAKEQEYDRLLSHVSQFEIDIFRDRV